MFKGRGEMEPSFQNLLNLHFFRSRESDTFHSQFLEYLVTILTVVKITIQRIKEPDKKVGFDSTAYPKESGKALRTLEREPFLHEERRNRCLDPAATHTLV